MVCYFSLDKLQKKGSNIGHLDNRSEITEKEIQVSKRTPENLHWENREKTYYTLRHVCLSVCQPRVKSWFSSGQTLVIFRIEKFYYNTCEKIQIALLER